MRVNDKMVEGRYYLIYLNGELQLANGFRMDGTRTPSYLKSGLNQDLVNGGTVASLWPNLHDPIISSRGLECASAEFNEVMFALLYSHVAQFLSNYINLFENSSQVLSAISCIGFTVDVAWSNRNIATIEFSKDRQVVIPKPILMETTYKFAFQDDLI